MLKIRLTRTGKTKRPHYRVVVMEHTSAAQGPYVAALGIWDPLTHKLHLDEVKLREWMDRGARPTDRISRLLKQQGLKHKLIQIHERPARGPKKKVEKTETHLVGQEKVAEVQAESPAPETTAAEAPAGTHPTEKASAEISAEEAQQTNQEVKVEEAKPADTVEPAVSEVRTNNVEGEEQAKSPAGDQA